MHIYEDTDEGLLQRWEFEKNYLYIYTLSIITYAAPSWSSLVYRQQLVKTRADPTWPPID